ncbi:MAG: hypothetical protein AAFR04_12595 [Pseudomonadota bacterium]
MGARTRPERVDLATFLAPLDETQAAQMRAAAARIDELEAQTRAFEGIERRYVPAFAVGLALFVLALGVLLAPAPVLSVVEGSWRGLALSFMLGVLPATGAVFAWNVRHRTSADNEKFELNKTHFVPRGGLYFAAHNAQDACVVRIAVPPIKDEAARLPLPHEKRQAVVTRYLRGKF